MVYKKNKEKETKKCYRTFEVHFPHEEEMCVLALRRISGIDLFLVLEIISDNWRKYNSQTIARYMQPLPCLSFSETVDETPLMQSMFPQWIKYPKHLAESKLNKEVPKRPWLDQQPFPSCYEQQPVKANFLETEEYGQLC